MPRDTFFLLSVLHDEVPTELPDTEKSPKIRPFVQRKQGDTEGLYGPILSNGIMPKQHGMRFETDWFYSLFIHVKRVYLVNAHSPGLIFVLSTKMKRFSENYAIIWK